MSRVQTMKGIYGFGYLAWLKLVSLVIPQNRKATKVRKIGDYTRDRETDVITSRSPYDAGIYVKQGTRYFIKSYTYRTKDFNYHILMSEYWAAQFLASSLGDGMRSGQWIVKTPRPIELYEESGCISVVYECVNGRGGSMASPQVQGEMVSAILQTLSRVTRKTGEDRIPTITTAIMQLSIPILTICSVWNYPHDVGSILRWAWTTSKGLYKSLNTELSLAHRDLKPDNWLYKGKEIYIIDCAQMAYTIAGYDREYIAVTAPEISRQLAKKDSTQKGPSALQKYLILNKISGSKTWSGKYLAMINNGGVKL